jgi:hypothetical protein
MTALSSPKPSVVPNSFLVTASVEVRDNLWNALQETLNHAIYRERVGSTQFSVKPLPEYTEREVYLLTVAYLYSILMEELPLEEFMALSPSEHLNNVREMITLSPGEAVLLTEEELMEPLTMRFARLAYIEVRGLYRTIEYSKVGTGTHYDRWQYAVNAYRRLNFMNSSQTFVSIEQWQASLTEAQDQVEILEGVYRHAVEINSQVQQLVRESDTYRKEFGEVVDKAFAGEMSVQDLLVAYLNATSTILFRTTRISELAQSFSDAAALRALRRIKEITPAE